MVNKNRNNEHFLLLTEEKTINKNLNQSQIIPDYELIKSLNPYYSDYFENKIILNILTRKNENVENLKNFILLLIKKIIVILI